MNIEQMNGKDIVKAAIRAVAPQANRYHPRFRMWVEGDNGCGGDYCPKCIGAAVQELRKRYPENRERFSKGGGWGGDETEGPLFCARCGHILDYVLLPLGVDEELEHYESDGGLSPRFRHSPYESFQLMKVLEEYEPLSRDMDRDAVRAACGRWGRAKGIENLARRILNLEEEEKL